MNFGIIANESIDTAYIAPVDDADLSSFYKKWNGLFDHVKLHCYVIKTSSTGITLPKKGIRCVRGAKVMKLLTEERLFAIVRQESVEPEKWRQLQSFYSCK